MSSGDPQTRPLGRGRAAVALLASLFALAIVAPSAQAAEVPNHLFEKTVIGGFKSLEPPITQLEDPCGVAFGPVGELYVSDYYRHEVRAGSSAIKINSENGPCGLAVDAVGNVYVNLWHGPVVKYEPNFYPPEPFAPPITYSPTTVYPGSATGIAIDPFAKRLFVNERTSIAIYALPVEAKDEPLARIGVGTLEDGYGVAASSFSASKGQVYAADAASRTVKVYDSAAGESAPPLRQIDGAGTPQGRFVSLVDASLATDQGNGELFVADNTQPGFEHPAAVVNEFNAEGLYRGQLEHALVHGEPVGIALNAAGNVYVTSGNGLRTVLPPPKEGVPATEFSALYAFGPAGEGRTLGVTESGTGTGTVGSSPAGIACPGACKAEFNAGASVTLTATPSSGSAFAGWSGGGCAGTAPCHLVLAAAATVNAEFVPAPVGAALTARQGASAGETEAPVVGSRATAKKPKRAHRRFARAKAIALRAAHRRSEGKR